MKITNISATAFKGGSFSHDLGIGTLIVGDNWSGKTRVLEAIRLALLGYDLRLGKRPGDIMALASGPKMSVTAKLDNGDSVSRTYCLKNGKSASAEEDVPTGWAYPPVFLDVREFFNLTGAERDDYILSHSREATVDPKKVLQVITTVGANGWGDAHKAVIDVFAESAMERLNIGAEMDDNPYAVLGRIIEDAEEAKAAAKKTVAAGTGAVAVGTMVSGDAPQVPADIDQRIAAGKQIIENLVSAQSLWDAYRKQDARRAELQSVIKSVVPLPQGVPDNIHAIDIKAVEDAITSNQAEHESLTKEATKLAATQNHQLQVCKDLAKRVELINEERKRLNEAVTCPVCGTDASMFRDRVIAHYDVEEAVLSSEIKAAVALGVEAEELMAGVKDKLNVNEGVKKNLDERKKALELGQAIYASVLQAKAELATLSSAKPEGDPAKLAEVLTDARAQLAALEQQKNRKLAHDAEVLATEKANLVRSMAQAQLDVYTQIVKVLSAFRSKLAEEAMGGLSSRVARFTEGIVPGKVVFKKGDMALVRGLSSATHWTFSGTEELIAYAGLAVALAEEAPVRIVLVDELGRLTEDNKVKLLERLLALARDNVIDQFVAVDVNVMGTVSGDINVIRI